MNFDSFEFFASLLPAMLLFGALLTLVGGVLRRVLIILAGTYALALLAPRLAAAHLAYWVLAAAVRWIVARRSTHRDALVVLWAGLAVLLAPLVLWKLFPDAFTADFNDWSNRAIGVLSQRFALIDLTSDVLVPVGLSFATFRALDLVVKAYLGEHHDLRADHVVAYGMFPALLVVGPIAQYHEVAPALGRRTAMDSGRAAKSLLLVGLGLTKVFVGALPLQWSADVFAVYDVNPAWRIQLALAAFGVYFWLNFSGYCDLAVATATWLGADVLANFDAPYLKTDPSRFWNAWHISLTSFLRRNVFVPLGGFRTSRFAIATAATMLAIGLWHALRWNGALFGVYHAVSMLAHQALRRRRPARPGTLAAVLKPVAVFVWFVASLPMIVLPFGQLDDFYRALLLGGRG